MMAIPSTNRMFIFLLKVNIIHKNEQWRAQVSYAAKSRDYVWGIV